MNRINLIWLTIFTIAMGYMESAVVVYLRQIYYPQGFNFPIVPLDGNIASVEIFREAATLIMLIAIGILSSRTASLRFANFLWCFAIWDLFYYLFLWIILDWPQSFFTWDILFLIPVPWVGPVLTPCLISLTMMVLASTIFYFANKGINTRLNLKEWSLLIAGSFIVILSFIWDYLHYISSVAVDDDAFGLSEKTGSLNDLAHYTPENFNWFLFLCGYSMILTAIAHIMYRFNKMPFSKS